MSIQAGKGTSAELEGRIGDAGVHEDAASDRARLLSHVVAGLERLGVSAGTLTQVHWVPGRIELLGKHTDYAGGRSLLAATERGFWFAAVPAPGRGVQILDAVGGERTSFDLSPDLAPTVGHWSNYPMTVARRLARNFEEAGTGALIAFGSDLPQASGMSSSSAMITGFFLTLAGVNGLKDTSTYRSQINTVEEQAGYLGTIENGQSFGELAGDKGVGTFGGSEDHTAILTCCSGRLNQYAYCPVRFERQVALPDGLTFVIGTSGVVAEKTGTAMDKYNRASQLALEAGRAWRKHAGSDAANLAAALAESGGAAEPIREALRQADCAAFSGSELLDRFDQFYEENEQIVPLAGDALERGDLSEFGDRVDRSQELTTDLLKNQVPETVHLARSARELGAVAASAFGAGFGGSVWALVEVAVVRTFVQRWSQSYQSAYPQRSRTSDFFTTRAGQGAFEL